MILLIGSLIKKKNKKKLKNKKLEGWLKKKKKIKIWATDLEKLVRILETHKYNNCLFPKDFINTNQFIAKIRKKKK